MPCYQHRVYSYTSLVLTFDLCRELYKGMSVSMILDESSESVDSEDAEHMKVSRAIVKPDGGPFTINPGVTRTRLTSLQVKLRVLKQYVFELKESYDELLRAFSQLELAAKDKIAVLENRLLAALNTAKVDQRLALPRVAHLS